MAKKIQVQFTDKQIALLNELKGELGETDADVVRNLVLAWLAEKSVLSTFIKKRLNSKEVPNGISEATE